MHLRETVVLWKGGALTFLGVGRSQEAGVADHAVDVPGSVLQHVVATGGKMRHSYRQMSERYRTGTPRMSLGPD